MQGFRSPYLNWRGQTEAESSRSVLAGDPWEHEHPVSGELLAIVSYDVPACMGTTLAHQVLSIHSNMSVYTRYAQPRTLCNLNRGPIRAHLDRMS